MAKRLKKGDQVIVRTGNSKGHVGVIDKVISDEYLIVSGANMRKKYIKADRQNNIEGEIKSIEGKIHVSNVAMYDVSAEAKIKVGFKINEDGTKVRVNKVTGEPL